MNSISRRKFIKYSSAGAGILAFNFNPVIAWSQVQNYQRLDIPEAPLFTHLLNRISFGANVESYQQLQQMGYEDYIEYQLDTDSIDDSVLEDFIAEFLPTVNMSALDINELIRAEEINQFQAADELKSATFLRAVYSKKQLLQVMVEFWNNHFSVFHFDGPVAVLKTIEDREVIRPNALSSFPQLLQADAKSPAMLYYLDTYSSSKESPNENYARELMELHTLGVDGPYTHSDIDEIARCFTGWSISLQNGDFRFNRRKHDYGEKTVLGQTIAAGGGVTDGEQVLDILAKETSTAMFIAKKLCTHFISDSPDQDIVESTADIFASGNGDIKQCLRHILLSDSFINAQNQKFKRPYNYLTAAARAFSAKVYNSASMRENRRILQNLGQAAFNWQTPDGYPDTASFWQSTNGMLHRWNFASALSYQELRGYNYNFSQLINAPYTPENIYSQLITKILFRNMNNDDESALLQYLNESTINNIVPENKIKGALSIVLGSPYFQLS